MELIRENKTVMFRSFVLETEIQLRNLCVVETSTREEMSLALVIHYNFEKM